MNVFRNALALALLLLLPLATACSSPPAEPSPAASTPAPQGPGRTYTAAGAQLATTVETEAMARAWAALALGEPLRIAVAEESFAVLDVAEGRADAALVLRHPSPQEIRIAEPDQLAARQGLQTRVLGLLPVTFLVHDDNPVTSLSPDRVAELLTGRVGDWAAVGGKAGDVHLYASDPATAAMAQLRSWLGAGEVLAAGVRIMGSDRAVARAVAADRRALGVGGPAVPGARQLPLRLDDGALLLPATPSESGTVWPIMRPLVLVSRRAPGGGLASWLTASDTAQGRAVAERSGLLVGGAP